MDYKDVSKCQSEAVESDWLDITYTQRKYIQEEVEAVEYSKPKKQRKSHKGLLTVVACLAAVALIVCGMIFVNGNSNIFETARLAYTSGIFKGIESVTEKTKVELPVNAEILSIKSDGTVEIGGGKLCMNLVGGTVVSVTDNVVTVEIEDGVKLVYSNLNKILVASGDKVDKNAVLGKYDESMKVNVVVDDSVVTAVSGGAKAFEWSN